VTEGVRDSVGGVGGRGNNARCVLDEMSELAEVDVVEECQTGAIETELLMESLEVWLHASVLVNLVGALRCRGGS
jgi:hypothetical protein